jgi:ATP-dependent Lhr-like helicase
MDDPYIVPAEEVPYYAAATKKERELNSNDRAVLDKLEGNMSLSELAEATELSEDIVFRSLRKLESMYEVTRVQINGNNKWYFARYLEGFADRDESICHIIEQYLECFAPATAKEIA